MERTGPNGEKAPMPFDPEGSVGAPDRAPSAVSGHLARAIDTDEELNEETMDRAFLETVKPVDEAELEFRKAELWEFALSFGLLRDVVKARSGRWKTIWTALALTALGTCSYEVWILTDRYLQAPTNTKITYRVNSSMSFPIVTVCTYSRLNYTRVQEMNINHDLLTYILSAFKGMYSAYNEYNIRNKVSDMIRIYEDFKAAQSANFSLTQFFIANGFDCPEFLKACMFQGVDIPCCTNPAVLSDVGKCFVVDSDKYTTQDIPGPNGGLRISINNHAELYPETFINTNSDMGIQIHIIPPTSTTFIGVSPLVIFPGTHALVRLNAVHRSLIPDENNEGATCTRNRKLKYFDTYSFEGCFTECIAGLTEQTCRCIQIGTIPDYRRIGDDAICPPAVATECVQALLQADNMGFLWDMYDIKTVCDCPLPCDEWYYETSVSYSLIPNPGYRAEQRTIALQREPSNFTSPSASEDGIILDVFYGDLVYTKIQETELMSRTIYLSKIGGQMSIWLGIRLVSLVLFDPRPTGGGSKV